MRYAGPERHCSHGYRSRTEREAEGSRICASVCQPRRGNSSSGRLGREKPSKPRYSASAFSKCIGNKSRCIAFYIAAVTKRDAEHAGAKLLPCNAAARLQARTRKAVNHNGKDNRVSHPQWLSRKSRVGSTTTPRQGNRVLHTSKEIGLMETLAFAEIWRCLA
jgi:hypothetical protein